MAYIKCDNGPSDTFIAKRFNGDSLTGQVTIDRDGTFEVWVPIEKSYINSYGFKLNNTDITSTLTTNALSTLNASQGWGYTETWFTASTGDVLSWTVGYSNRAFVIFISVPLAF